MDNLLPYLVTGIVSFAVGYALKFVEPKSRLVWWSPHNFLFELDINPGQPKLLLLTHSISIQNIGRKPAEIVEIAHKFRPDYFKLQPALDYDEDLTPAQEHIIRVPTLAPREFFTIEFLSYRSLPELLYIRSKGGPAKNIVIQAQRVFPRSIQLLSAILLLAGGGLLIYWVIRAFSLLFSALQ